MEQFISHSVQETEDYAAGIAPRLSPGDVIACRGGMGMGKTAFARGLARGMRLSDPVSSPTFAFVREYTQGEIPLYHFDMYRVEGYDSLYSTGFFDYLEGEGVLLIEWSENIADELPDGCITLTIERIGDDSRRITLEGGPF